MPCFRKRMFEYFIRLIEKYGLPVYPVVIFSYDIFGRELAKRGSRGNLFISNIPRKGRHTAGKKAATGNRRDINSS
jgi:hypothetical protein